MKRILLVEDNNAIRENTCELLELANYTVLSACNGKEGLDMALKEKPDLIICDIMMPEIDGYHLLEILRRESFFENTPFVFFTASAEKSEIKKGLDAGANDYITKPFDADDLVQLIVKYLGE
ncbi:response regulator [Niastella caeni]|uniref:Response regulator n=1 Tax=Niastella caeni TaxID=2569763 RepID=A0A4S8HZC7_9BACT|nr:response regulator [Niastella caeni]THU39534.1 response regulator [Niastella caeni]